MKLLFSLLFTAVIAFTSFNLWASVPDKDKESLPETVMQHQKLDLNTASAKALQALPGIGEKKAAAIVAYRNTHGNFTSIEQLKQVKGIGEATLKNIKAQLALKN